MGATLSCDAWASLDEEHGVEGVQASSSCGARALGHRLSSCGTWSLFLRGM